MAMYGDIHDMVKTARLGENKHKASQISVEHDLCHMDNAIDSFTKLDEWDMNDEPTRKLVEAFQGIKEKFVQAKRIIERAQ